MVCAFVFEHRIPRRTNELELFRGQDQSRAGGNKRSIVVVDSSGEFENISNY